MKLDQAVKITLETEIPISRRRHFVMLHLYFLV